MSAFIVTEETIRRCVEGVRELLTKQRVDYAWPHDPSDIGQALWDMNESAVRQRYPGEGNDLPGSEITEYRHRKGYYNNLQQIHALQCLLYQCSEGNVPETPLFKATTLVAGEIALHVVRNLPAYDKLAWDPATEDTA